MRNQHNFTTLTPPTCTCLLALDYRDPSDRPERVHRTTSIAPGITDKRTSHIGGVSVVKLCWVTWYPTPSCVLLIVFLYRDSLTHTQRSAEQRV